MSIGEEIEKYTKEIANNPDNYLAFCERGKLNRFHDNESSLADLDEAIRINPKFANGYFQRALTYINRRDFTIIHSNLGDDLVINKIRQDLDLARNDLDQAIKIDPEFDESYLQRGLLSWKHENSAPALADFTAAIRINPISYKAYLYRGYTNYKNHNYDAAIEDFDSSISLEPNFHAFWRKGIIELNSDDRTSALIDFTHALEFSPPDDIDFDEAYNFSGRRFYWEDAIEDEFNRIIKEFPEIRALSLYRKAEVRYEIDDERHYANMFAELILGLEFCLCSEGQNDLILKIKKFLYFILWDVLLSDLENHEESVEYLWVSLSRLAELCHDWSAPHFAKAFLKAEYFKDFEGAIIDYNSVIKIDPNNAKAFYNRGEAKFKLGDLEGARSDYEIAIGLDPDAGKYYDKI